MTKILIIDDEIDIANNISAILTDENYEVYKASNSDQAFNLMSLNKFDLLIKEAEKEKEAKKETKGEKSKDSRG